VTPGKQLPQQ